MMLHWLLHTDAGLSARIFAGCAIFAALAITDLHRRGRQATRWREYGVLFCAVVIALLYGAINDQITVTISPEYFIFGKELYRTVGENPPMPVLRWAAAKVGFKATWSAGLIFGAVLLMANNPYRGLPRLRNRQLVMFLPMIALIAAAFGVAGGWFGYHRYLIRLDGDFADLVASNMYRPDRFMAAWGVHLGGYCGGVAGTITAILLLIAARKQMKQKDDAHPLSLNTS